MDPCGHIAPLPPRRFPLALIFGAALAAIIVGPALAGTTSGTSMPYETALQTFADSLTGPVAKLLGIIIIALTGLGFAIAESGTFMRKAIAVVFGLSIAFSAATMTGLFGLVSGAVF